MEEMITAPWVGQFHLLVMKEQRIVALSFDMALRLSIHPVQDYLNPVSTLLTAKEIVVSIEHLGSGLGASATTKMKIADPKFFDIVEDLMERINDE